MRRVTDVCLLLVLLAGLLSEVALACDCASAEGSLESQVRAALGEADAVFSAEVLDIENFQAAFEQFQATKLRVIESWKGPHSPQSIVRTSTITDCCLCGITVQKGQRILVYVHGAQPYKLSDCSRTRALDDAEGEVQTLRKTAGSTK